MPIKNEQPKSPTRLWLRVLFGLSLALNLLVLGVVGGAIIRFGGYDGMRVSTRSVGAAMYRELPREDRRALWDGSRGLHNVDPARYKADALVIVAAMRAVPFDANALRALLGEHATRRAVVQNAAQDGLLIRLSEMSDGERQAYADRLEEALNRPRMMMGHMKRRHD
jgi:hypothetical protein